MTITQEVLDMMDKADLKRQLMGIGSMHPSWLVECAETNRKVEYYLNNPCRSRRQFLERVREQNPDRFSDETWERMIAEASDTEMI